MGLALRNLLFTVVVPGAGAVYAPWWILTHSGGSPEPVAWIAVIMIAPGAALYFWCLWLFATVGRGTPGPWDAPRRFVAVGLYRWVRNPIYLAALLVVLGEARLFLSLPPLVCAGALAWGVHAFVIGYEEPRCAVGSAMNTRCTYGPSRAGSHGRPGLRVPGWTFWELRTLNRHRVVGLLTEYRSFADVRDLEDEVRAAIAANFRRAWWRGLAFGVVAQVGPLAWKPDDLEPLVDIYENRKGVFQWLVLTTPHGHRAIGAHTWESVFLSPVYREVLDGLTAGGYEVTTAVKGKGGLWKFLTGVSELKGVSFPEFRDPS
jgi:hypothetical protein